MRRSAEAELIIWCARSRLDSPGDDDLQVLLRQGIDWEYLLTLARPHGMLPLLYWRLNAACPESVPETTLHRLRDHFHDNARRNLIRTRELLDILDLLEQHEITAVAFKGPVLAAALYGNLALRQFRDLDILVHDRDVGKARNLLTSRGYRARFQGTDAQEAAYLRSQCEHEMLGDDGVGIVELHWRFVPRYFCFPLDLESIAERLTPVAVSGRQVRTLSPEDLLVVLCVHGAKHRWERLSWICDVARLIGEHRSLQWGLVMDQAARLGSMRMLFLGLRLATQLLGAAIPEKILRKIQEDPAGVALAAQIQQEILRGGQDSAGNWERQVFFLKVRERWTDRARYCLRLATTPSATDWEFLPLPPALFSLYPLVRLVRLAGKFGPLSWIGASPRRRGDD